METDSSLCASCIKDCMKCEDHNDCLACEDAFERKTHHGGAVVCEKAVAVPYLMFVLLVLFLLLAAVCYFRCTDWLIAFGFVSERSKLGTVAHQANESDYQSFASKSRR